MAERNERPLFEGGDRRSGDRRHAVRRKSEKYKKLLQYTVVLVLTILFVKVFEKVFEL